MPEKAIRLSGVPEGPPAEWVYLVREYRDFSHAGNKDFVCGTMSEARRRCEDGTFSWNTEYEFYIVPPTHAGGCVIRTITQVRFRAGKKEEE